MLRNDRRLLFHPLYVQGYRAALIMARADLHALNGSFQREMTELYREVEELRQEVARLRALAGLRERARPEPQAICCRRRYQPRRPHQQICDYSPHCNSMAVPSTVMFRDCQTGGENDRLGASAYHGSRRRLRHSISVIGPETPSTKKTSLVAGPFHQALAEGESLSLRPMEAWYHPSIA